MQPQCSADLFGFAPVEGRAVVAGFDGGRRTSDAGALLLGATDRRQFARATCGTIRLKLLKIGALGRTSVRRIKFAQLINPAAR